MGESAPRTKQTGGTERSIAKMSRGLKKVADAAWFHHAITTVIVLAGVLVGVETYQDFAHRHQHVLDLLDQIVIGIFVLEVAIKMGAEGGRPWRYFVDPWNVFDFTIVVACFMPVNAQYVMVLRLARLLRVLKLVRALPKLQVLVGALLKSVPSIGYVSLLLLLLFYVYAVAATLLFAGNDPVHFATLPLSMLSLFRAVTLEDWTDLMYINQYGCNAYGYVGQQTEALCTAPEAFPLASPLLFVSLILIGTMIVLNLFIGVIMNGMDAARAERDRDEADLEHRRSKRPPPSLADELGELTRQAEQLQTRIAALRCRAEQEAGASR
jgi:voltage-gated sodium channel